MSEELPRLGHHRLEQECANLRPEEERAAAEEFFVGEVEPDELQEVVDGLDEIIGDR